MLRDEARKQGKPFGLLFDNIEGGFTNTGRGSANAFNVLPNIVFKIYTDPSRPPELVRGVDLIGTPLAAFAKIVATGDKVDVFNGVCGAESGGVPVSASSPPLLVSEVEVQKKAQSQEPLPILPAPRQRWRSPDMRTHGPLDGSALVTLAVLLVALAGAARAGDADSVRPCATRWRGRWPTCG